MAKRSVAQRRNMAPALLTGVLLLLLLGIAVAVVLFVLSWFQGALATPGGMPGLPSSTGSSENVKYSFGSALPTWTGENRVTVLVLGIDERSQESGPWRTDTMMLVTLDPKTLRAGALSIPRDLWVPIPGHNSGRINTAHFLGDLYGHPGGGPARAVETVEYNLGVPIDYYIRVNFHGFIEVVNLIGGIDIYVEERIDDAKYPDGHYGYEHLVIEPGWHHFDGSMALKYARTRHGSSDFARARRQQQVMLAILDRIVSLELLPDLARNASEIYATVDTSIQTDLALDQILALANLATQVDQSQIRFGVIDGSCTQNWTTPEGSQVLVPLREKMREVRDYVFFENEPTPTPTQEPAQSNLPPAPTATPEPASIAVLNGTLQSGFAGQTGGYLQKQGLNVVEIANADRQNYANSMVILHRDKETCASQIIKLLRLPPSALIRGQQAESAQDIVVILGEDYPGPPD
jgi:polyisoprenyl-teichoic acid--peptidoglycan teichoic acid transferase